MPAFACSVEHGTIPSNSTLKLVEDEASLLVTSVTRAGSREKTEFRNGDGCVTGLRYFNPRLDVDITGHPTSVSASVVSDEPGAAITSLANFASATPGPASNFFGFVIADGVTVHEDPTLEASNDGAPTFSFRAAHYPFVA